MVHEQGIELNVETAQMRVEEGTSQSATCKVIQKIETKYQIKLHQIKIIICFADKYTSKEMDHSNHIDHSGDRVNDYNWYNYLADTLKFQHLF
jgi:hypothetical protein